jgi:hypothetical protein
MKREGWRTLDANPKHTPDFVALIPPFPYSVSAIEWDEVEWVHGISSLYPWAGLEALKCTRRLLQAKGGRLSLEQPNIVAAARAFAVDGKPLFWIFGDPDPREPLHMNCWGYTPETLRAALKESGFRNIVEAPVQYHSPIRDFRMEAYA